VVARVAEQPERVIAADYGAALAHDDVAHRE
jgi:hypothetical protein